MENKFVYVVNYFDCAEVDVYASAEGAIAAGQAEVDAAVQFFRNHGDDKEAEKVLNEWKEEVEMYGAEYSVEDVVWCRMQRLFD